MIALLGAAAVAATPYFGAEWRPLSRGDLTWVLDGATTGLVVGGLDGFVRPQVVPYGGAWLGRRVGVHGSIGMARLQTTTETDGVVSQRHWGVVELASDVRFALLERTDPRPNPWLFLGGHVDLPSARDTSDGYTEDEQELADEGATADRRQLGGFGARLGVGADLGVLPYLRLGLSWCAVWHRGSFPGADPTDATSFVSAEGALLLQLEWPRRAEQ
jgi:hypothetical protein